MPTSIQLPVTANWIVIFRTAIALSIAQKWLALNITFLKRDSIHTYIHTYIVLCTEMSA